MINLTETKRRRMKKNMYRTSYTIAQSTAPKRCPADDHRQHEMRPISHSLSLSLSQRSAGCSATDWLMKACAMFSTKKIWGAARVTYAGVYPVE